MRTMTNTFAAGKRMLTIRKKLLFVCSFLLIVPIAALGLATYQVTDEETTALIENGLKNNVRLASEMLGVLDKAVQDGLMTKEAAQERFKSSLLGERLTDNTRPINRNFDLGDNGYFFILDDKGLLLAHPLLEGQNIWDKKTSDGTYYIQDLLKKAQEGGGFTYYDWPLPNSDKEAEKVAYAERADAWGWTIAAGSYMKDYNSGQRHIVNVIFLTLGICLAGGAILLTLFAQHISRPLIRMAGQAERIASGDLTGEAYVPKRQDEIGTLAVAFQHLQNNLRELAGNQSLSAGSLASSSAHLSDVISETVGAANETTRAITELAAHNETQVHSIEETSRAMEEMTIGIQKIAASSVTAFDASSRTLAEAEKGHILIVRSSEQMNDVSGTVVDLSSVVHRLGDRSEQIGEIAGAISELAGQTNLLALNASIEAARAGEHGKGFAVVAGEIRKLAERSNESAAKVSGLTEAIRGEIGYAIESMRKSEREVQTGVASIQETGEAFARILQATRSVAAQVEEASAAAEEMSASSQEIAAALQQMERVSSTTAEAAQTISGATEEQLASLEEIEESAGRLRTMSDDMKRQANKFKL
ncbi:methyl-accepting chemotaxis protein [Cohnella faecalis]|uniref:Methyl-accepting chemotaxis protein n=1 Tax=Cohnella faecalis TaxID=2315694 RepID=A0A398CQE8_9BACL|nr:methyl-accepting chemotaxis protein [Cohnella faecalis]RIE03018.1 methyl-accepting chemotaxis protein [Cohnella faecalis]